MFDTVEGLLYTETFGSRPSFPDESSNGERECTASPAVKDRKIFMSQPPALYSLCQADIYV